MENVIYIILLVLTIILFKFVFKINLKKAKAVRKIRTAFCIYTRAK